MESEREMISPPNGEAPNPDVMRNQYRELHAEDCMHIRHVKKLGADLHNYVSSLGAGRELAIAKTKIEEAVMWAVKAITS
jgi:hypothetical protein